MNKVGLGTMALTALVLSLLSTFSLAQTTEPALRVRVVDQQNAVIETAAAALVDTDGNKITASQASPGYYEFRSVKPGAEHERIGFGRIEILTKPGSDRYHGEASFGFNDESLNSRNPLAPNRPPYQARRYEFEFGGPLIKNKSSFSFDLERRDTEDNAVVSATLLDENLNITPFSLALVTPQNRTHVSTRVDYQLTPRNTLVGRLRYFKAERTNEGIGQFSLPSRGYDVESHGYDASLTETAMISPQLVNETRFRYESDDDRRTSLNNEPGIRVLEAFTGGGAQVGRSGDESREFEVENVTSWLHGQHSIKAGFELEAAHQTDISESNYGGTFTYGGGVAPVLDAANRPVMNADGSPALEPTRVPLRRAPRSEPADSKRLEPLQPESDDLRKLHVGEGYEQH